MWFDVRGRISFPREACLDAETGGSTRTRLSELTVPKSPSPDCPGQASCKSNRTATKNFLRTAVLGNVFAIVSMNTNQAIGH